MQNKERYHRRLPHIQPLGATFFITFSLEGSIPQEVKAELQKEYKLKKNYIVPNSEVKELIKLRKKNFLKYDTCLHLGNHGNHYLKNELVAVEVKKSLQYWDQKFLDLICFCIMSNHVHLVVKLLNKDEQGKLVYLHKILQSIKQYSSRSSNKILNRTGTFWQEESYDYQVRDKNELYRIINYVLDNPVKANLCKSRDQWQWSYIKDEYNEFI